MNEEANRPLFLASPPRSGSTFLQGALNAHPAIWMSEATGWVSILRRSELLATTPGSLRINDGEGFERPGEIVDAFVSTMRRVFPTAVHAFVDALLNDVLSQRPDVRFFGEKVHSPNDLGFVSRMFPWAKVVVLARDPRDVLFSTLEFDKKTRMSWTDVPVKERCEHLRWHFGVLSEAAERRNGILVRYRDLVGDPARELDRIFGWIGVDREAGVDEWLRVDAAKLFARHGTASDPRNSVGRGKDQLSSDALALCEEICAEAIEQFGGD